MKTQQAKAGARGLRAGLVVALVVLLSVSALGVEARRRSTTTKHPDGSSSAQPTTSSKPALDDDVAEAAAALASEKKEGSARADEPAVKEPKAKEHKEEHREAGAGESRAQKLMTGLLMNSPYFSINKRPLLYVFEASNYGKKILKELGAKEDKDRLYLPVYGFMAKLAARATSLRGKLALNATNEQIVKAAKAIYDDLEKQKDKDSAISTNGLRWNDKDTLQKILESKNGTIYLRFNDKRQFIDMFQAMEGVSYKIAYFERMAKKTVGKVPLKMDEIFKLKNAAYIFVLAVKKYIFKPEKMTRLFANNQLLKERAFDWVLTNTNRFQNITFKTEEDKNRKMKDVEECCKLVREFLRKDGSVPDDGIINIIDIKPKTTPKPSPGKYTVSFFFYQAVVLSTQGYLSNFRGRGIQLNLPKEQEATVKAHFSIKNNVYEHKSLMFDSEKDVKTFEDRLRALHRTLQEKSKLYSPVKMVKLLRAAKELSNTTMEMKRRNLSFKNLTDTEKDVLGKVIGTTNLPKVYYPVDQKDYDLVLRTTVRLTFEGVLIIAMDNFNKYQNSSTTSTTRKPDGKPDEKNCKCKSNPKWDQYHPSDRFLALVRTRDGSIAGRKLDKETAKAIMEGALDKQDMDKMGEKETVEVSYDRAFALPAGHYYFPQKVHFVGFKVGKRER